MTVPHRLAAFSLLLPLLLVGCDTETETQATTDVTSDLPVEEPPKQKLNAAGILIAFRGRERAAGIERTRREALAIAKDLSSRARAGEDFYELAREHSDGTRAQAGGVFGNFTENDEVKQVVDTTLKMNIGDISDPVETPYGYYVLLRREIEDVYNASHILLLHNDSKPKPEALKRTREEALALAQGIRESLDNGDSFNKLAMELSNGPGRKQAGQMGNFTLAQLPAYFAKVGEVVKDLEVGEVSEPFETEVGVHLVKRQAIPRPVKKMGAKHVLVMYRGAMRADKITRSKEAALDRIRKVQEKLTSGGKFEDLAIEYSDCPSSADGGKLPLFGPRDMVKEFSDATANCAIGGYTDIIESPFGYHLIYRYQ